MNNNLTGRVFLMTISFWSIGLALASHGTWEI